MNTAGEIWKSIEKIEKFIFSKKVFVIWKKSRIFWTKFWNQKQIGKIEKTPTIQTISNFENCKKSLETGVGKWKKIVKNQKQMLRNEKLLTPIIDFDVEKNH